MISRRVLGARDCDVAIVGAGPAGAACALTAARAGLSVRLFDPWTGEHDKPCGEGIMPAGVAALEELGLLGALGPVRPFERLRYVIAGRPALTLPLPSPGLALRRPELQRALDEALAAEPGVERCGARAEAERRLDGGFDVTSEDERLRARCLVAADGRGGRQAPWLRGGRPAASSGERMGLRARFRHAEPLECVEVHMGVGSEVYLTPLADGLVNVAILTNQPELPVRGGRALLDWALGAHPSARRRLAELVTTPELRPLSRPAPARVAEEGAFLVGDAGGGVDPILGCGVTIALRSGIAAGRACAEIAAGGRRAAASRAYARTYARECGKRRLLAAALRGLSRHPRFALATAVVAAQLPTLASPLVAIAAGVSESPAA